MHEKNNAAMYLTSEYGPHSKKKNKSRCVLKKLLLKQKIEKVTNKQLTTSCVKGFDDKDSNNEY